MIGPCCKVWQRLKWAQCSGFSDGAHPELPFDQVHLSYDALCLLSGSGLPFLQGKHDLEDSENL
ncbi:hypothetical protein JCM15831A_13830 [Asaia astilbis]